MENANALRAGVLHGRAWFPSSHNFNSSKIGVGLVGYVERQHTEHCGFLFLSLFMSCYGTIRVLPSGSGSLWGGFLFFGLFLF